MDASCSYFKPRGIPLSELDEVVLGKDALEAVRLADLEGMYQDAVAEKMGVSRQTVGRILEQARKCIADALINGKAIKVEGGTVYSEGSFSSSPGRGLGRRHGCGWRK